MMGRLLESDLIRYQRCVWWALEVVRCIVQNYWIFVVGIDIHVINGEYMRPFSEGLMETVATFVL